MAGTADFKPELPNLHLAGPEGQQGGDEEEEEEEAAQEAPAGGGGLRPVGAAPGPLVWVMGTSNLGDNARPLIECPSTGTPEDVKNRRDALFKGKLAQRIGGWHVELSHLRAASQLGFHLGAHVFAAAHGFASPKQLAYIEGAGSERKTRTLFSEVALPITADTFVLQHRAWLRLKGLDPDSQTADTFLAWGRRDEFKEDLAFQAQARRPPAPILPLPPASSRPAHTAAKPPCCPPLPRRLASSGARLSAVAPLPRAARSGTST